MRLPPEPILTFAMTRWARLTAVTVRQRCLERILDSGPTWVEGFEVREFAFRQDRKTRCNDECIGRWWISRGRVEEWLEPPEIEREPFVCYATMVIIGYCADATTPELYHVHIVRSRRERVSGWQIRPREDRRVPRWEWRRVWTRRVTSRGRGTHLLPAEIEKYTLR